MSVLIDPVTKISIKSELSYYCIRYPEQPHLILFIATNYDGHYKVLTMPIITDRKYVVRYIIYPCHLIILVVTLIFYQGN